MKRCGICKRFIRIIFCCQFFSQFLSFFKNTIINNNHYFFWIFYLLYLKLNYPFQIFFRGGTDIDLNKINVNNLLQKIPENFYPRRYYDHSKLLNLTNFEYILSNEKICKNELLSANRKLLILVHSPIENSKNREAIRSSFGSLKYFSGFSIHLAFLLSQTSKSLNFNIEQENMEFNDLVIGNFSDNYRSLSYKHIMGYMWADEFCPGIKYLVKLDDTMYLDLFNLIKLIEEHEADDENDFNQTLICNDMGITEPIRIRGYLSYITIEEYPNSTFPDYCSGVGYLILKTAVDKILEVSRNISTKEFLFIDDVFVTGTLRDKAKLKIKSVPDIYAVSSKLSEVKKYISNDSKLTEDFGKVFIYANWENSTGSEDTFKSRLEILWAKGVARNLISRKHNKLYFL